MMFTIEIPDNQVNCDHRVPYNSTECSACGATMAVIRFVEAVRRERGE